MSNVDLNLIPVDETQLVIGAGEETQLVLGAGDDAQLVVNAGDETQLVLSAGDNTQIVLSSVPVISNNGLMLVDGTNSDLALGNAGIPSLKFNGDANTGIFSPGADQVSISTGGTERLRVDGAGQIEAVSLGSAAAPTFSFTSDPNTGVYSPGADQLAISTAGTGRLFIDASGNVCIAKSPAGGPTYSKSLTIAALDASIALRANSSGVYADQGIFFAVDGTNYSQIYNDGNGQLIFRTGSGLNERLRITSAGDFGIGTSNPGALLETSRAASGTLNGEVILQRIRSNASNSVFVDIKSRRHTAGSDWTGVGMRLQHQVDGTAMGFIEFNSLNGGQDIAIGTGGSTRLLVNSTGLVGIGTSAPSAILDVRQNQAAYSYFDFYNITAGGGIVWRQIVRNLADTGTTSIDLAKYTSGGFAIANNDTGAANFTAFSVGASERLRITSAGLVGIGTSSPGSLLNLAHPTAADIRLTVGSTLQANIYSSSSDTNIFSVANNPLILGTNNTERLRITNAGSVGIGTTTVQAGHTLQVNGIIASVTSFGAFTALQAAGGTGFRWTLVNDGTFRLQRTTDGFASAVTNPMMIDASNRVGIGTTAPSQLLHVNGNTFVGAAAAAQWSVLTVAGDAALAAAAPIFHFVNAAGSARFAYINHSGTGGDLLVLNQEAGALRLGTNNAERARIDSSGRLLVGTSSSISEQFSGQARIQTAGTGYYGLSSFQYSNDIFESVASLCKSRGATVGTHAVVQANDSLASLRLQGSDGTGFLTAASITAQVDGTAVTNAGSFVVGRRYKILTVGDTNFTLIGASANTIGVIFAATGVGAGTGTATSEPYTNSMPGRLLFSTTADGASSPTERMRITSAGRVGIGTTSPGESLSIGGGANLYATLTSTNGIKTAIAAADANGFGWAGTTTNHAFALFSNNTERLRISSAGLVGIGTTAPVGILDVVTGTNRGYFDDSSGNLFRLNAVNAANSAYAPLTINGSVLTFQTGATERARITSAGNVGIGTTSPQAALDVNSSIRFGGLNTSVIPSSSAAGGCHVSWNFISGSAENDFYNIYENAPVSFLFRQKTGASTAVDVYSMGTQSHAFYISGTERARIDSSGRLLVGTSATAGFNHLLQVRSDTGAVAEFFTASTTAATAPYLVFSRSRGTAASPTVVSNGDVVGSLFFSGFSGSQNTGAAEIKAEIDGAPGVGDMPGRLIFSTTADGAGSPTERMRITSAGLVGIGTTSPGARLDVASSGGSTWFSGIFAGTGGTNKVVLGNLGSDLPTIGGHTSALNAWTDFRISGASIILANGNDEKARIDSSGRLLVGTSSRRRVGTPFDPNGGVFYESSGAAAYEAFTAAVNRNDLVGPVLSFGKSRGTANGSNTIVVADDELGTIRFSGADGTDLETIGASITAFVDGTPGANDMPGRLVFLTTADGAASPTERLRIDSTGQIEANGLGSAAAPTYSWLSDPDSGLYSPGANQLALSTGGAGRLIIGADGGVVVNTGALTLNATGGEGGQLVINNTTNTAAVYNLDASTDTTARLFTVANNTNLQIGQLGGTGGGIFLWTGSNERMRITSDGKVGIGTSTPVFNFVVAGSASDGAWFNSSGTVGRMGLGAIANGAAGAFQISYDRGTGLTNFGVGTRDTPSTAFTIDPSGRLGIGTTSPGALLDVLPPASAICIRARSSSTTALVTAMQFTPSDISTEWGAISASPSALNITHNTGTLALSANSTNAITFTTNSGERARIDSSGRLLVGTSSAVTTVISAGLQVQSSGANAYASIGRWDNNAASPGLLLNKSRGSSVGTRAVVQSGDILGEVSFMGDDGTSFITGAQILSVVDGTPGSTVMPGRLAFSTTSTTPGAGPTERMRIDSAGRVGIGTTGPTEALQVANGNILIGTGGSSAGYRALYFGATNASGRFAYIEKNNDSPFDFNIVAQTSLTPTSAINFKTTPTSTAATIDSSGRLLVGTSSSISEQFSGQARLQTAGTNYYGLASFQYSNDGIENVVSICKSRGASVGTHTVVQNNDNLGMIRFQGSDGTGFLTGATITGSVDGTPGANDMPGRLVFSTTADGASSPTERFRITNDGVIAHDQPAPAAVNATATLTIANLKTGIITSTSAAATDMTLPTGTDTQAGFSGTYDNFTFEWSVINTGPSLVRVLAGTAHTIVGSGSVATGTSGRFASRRTAANTFVTYRLT